MLGVKLAANGGSVCEEPPGPRGDLYLAYLRDPSGNKIYPASHEADPLYNYLTKSKTMTCNKPQLCSKAAH